MVGIETDPPTLVANLKAWLAGVASATDKAFPDNDQVRIENGEPIIRKSPKQSVPKGLERIESALDAHLPQTNILDVLIDTEKWLYLSRSFKPLSGHETKLHDHQERFVATLFCYGCNLGPTQTARSVQGFNRRQLSWLNLRHVTEEKLDEAIVKVVNAYNAFELPGALGERQQCLGRWHEMGGLRTEPAVRVAHSLRGPRWAGILRGIGHLHCPVQPFHPLRRVRGHLHS